MEKVKINDQEYIVLKINDLKFSEEDIESIKKSVTEYDDFDPFKEIRVKIGTDKILFAKLFLTAFDKFNESVYSFGDLKEKLSNYLDSFQIENLRCLIEQYGDGESFGDYYTREKIFDFVNKERNKMDQMINLFFRVFGEEKI